MDQTAYKDVSIGIAKYFLKCCGVCVPRNKAEDIRRKISACYIIGTLLYGAYVNSDDIYHNWGDLTYCMFGIFTLICIFTAIIKLLILNFRRFELVDAILFADRNFFNYHYDPHEQLILYKCINYCKWITFMVFIAVPGCLSGYLVPPIIANIGKNKSERVLPFKLWTDWPLADTPYYEMMFAFQALCVNLIALAYISPEMLMCLFNVHVVGQFRILQHRLLSFCESHNMHGDIIKHTEQCHSTLRKHIERHQILIEFCSRIEHVYTMTILTHMAVSSVLLGLDCFELIIENSTLSRRLVFVFHMLGTVCHLGILTYVCHSMIDESMGVSTQLYMGAWYILPMNQVGRWLRQEMKITMMRSMKPCCLTAGGFFPMSMQTFTTILSSTFSYFTLMRETISKIESN